MDRWAVSGTPHSQTCPLTTLRPAASNPCSSAARLQRPRRSAPPQPCRAKLVASAATQQSVTEPGDRQSDSGARMSYQPRGLQDLVSDATTSVAAAIEDGVKRLEVEFPPLSASGWEANFKNSDEYIDANVQLAISAANKLREYADKRIHIIVPDKDEYKRSYGMFKNSLLRSEGAVTMGYLLESKRGLFSNVQLFSGRQDQSPVPPSESAAAADIFMAINITSADLPPLERYVNEFVKGRALVLWNLELDTLRSDLGLIGFPSKDMQYRFLSSFKPVFYIRPRDYSKSISAPPFLVNYSGCLFRAYPGPWQCMLREPNGELASVAERQERFGLGEVKDELMLAMGLNTETPGTALAFLRRGFRTSTWWEDARDQEKFADWRT